jgi:hypothetical protein
LWRCGAPGAILACALGFAVPAVAAEPDPDKAAAEVITCPPGPPGWPLGGNGFSTAGDASAGAGGVNGRAVITPRTVLVGPDMTIAVGGNQVQVECNYQKGGRSVDHIIVLVRYALPRSFNPYADFYIGCKTKGSVATMSKPWDIKDRVYRVVSSKSWSYATFSDPYAVLEGNEAAGFQAIARTLLQRGEPVAHDCKLALKETGPLSLWTFGFNANVKNNGLTTTGGTLGTFTTRPNPQGGTGQLGHLNAHPIVLKIRKGSKLVGTVTLLVTQPLSFKYSYGFELRAEVKVTATTYAPCKKGATGTLMISTITRAATLQVCGRNVIQGTGTTRPQLSE